MHEKDIIGQLANFLGVETLDELSVSDISMMLSSAFSSMDTEDQVKLKAMKYIDDVVDKIAFMNRCENGHIHIYKIFLDNEKFIYKKFLTFYVENAKLIDEVLGKLGMVKLWTRSLN